MVYSFPRASTEIRQGDIFKDLPFAYIDLDELVIVDEQGQVNSGKTWEQVKDLSNITPKVKYIKKCAIVISQDCDNLRNEFISFALIQPLEEITGPLPTNPLKLVNKIIKGPSRSNYQWFYLPINRRAQISSKMAVNFDVLFQLSRESLLTRRANLRITSLNEISLNHFRDSLVKYFTRYAYNEWYFLNKEEFRTYRNDKVSRDSNEASNIIPYRYQR